MIRELLKMFLTNLVVRYRTRRYREQLLAEQMKAIAPNLR